MSSFNFSLTDGHVTMAASDGRPVTEAPPCAVCIIKDGARSLLCSDPTTDGSGPGALRDVDLRHFLTVMYRDGRSRPPWWFTNPFTYKRRERRYVATSCNPTLFSLDDEYQQRFERLLCYRVALGLAVPFLTGRSSTFTGTRVERDLEVVTRSFIPVLCARSSVLPMLQTFPPNVSG